MGKGGGGDHQSSANKILCAAAEGAFWEEENEPKREVDRTSMSFQVLSVEEGGRRLSEEGADCMLFVLQGMMSGADERQERERTDKEMSRY